MNPEQVIIDVIANDKALPLLENVRGKLEEIQLRINNISSSLSAGFKMPTMPKGVSQYDKPLPFPQVPTTQIQSTLDDATSKTNTYSQSVSDLTNKVGTFKTSMDDSAKSVDNSKKKIGEFSTFSHKSFHNVNTIIAAMASQLDSLSTSITGLFGAAGLSGMIEKMWTKAAERQTNMLFLIHQKGVSQANEYYNEIMDIVTQLPGDDTFLTNILNMMSAMDKNIKLDKLKELGTAITDYTIAATMKGELPFETQKDLRKYLTQGDTRSLRNSLLASEIDSLKNKNSILERGLALEKALDKLGFKGMSEYESATNELEEFKGHFQKAFADLGGIVIGLGQPILKLYNALDTLTDSRISQGIILLATSIVALLTAIGGFGLTFIFLTRTYESVVELATIFTRLILLTIDLGGVRQLLANKTALLLGVEQTSKVVREGNVALMFSEFISTLKLSLAKKLNADATATELISYKGLITSSLSLIKTQILQIANTIKRIILGVSEAEVLGAQIVLEGRATAANLTNAQVEGASNIIIAHNVRVRILKRIETVKGTLSTIKDSIENVYNTFTEELNAGSSLRSALAKTINTTAENSNTLAKIRNTLSKIKDLAITVYVAASIIFNTILTWLSTEANFAEAYAHTVNTSAKVAETGATYGLASALAILDALMAPEILIILAIVAAITALIVVVEKLGEAFGWWKDFGSMFQAIAEGINRMWNAFWRSDVVQGIIQYFGDFIDTVKYLFASLMDMLGLIFGWGKSDDGTFDIVQTLIETFGKLGDVIMWVWNLLDDFSNSPFGFFTWTNPLGILLFHLDEIGSFLEDYRDAIDRFTGTEEFQEMVTAIGEAIDELKEPFMEIMDLISEIIGLFSEIFSSQDPEAQGTEKRINSLVEVLKGLAFVIRNVVVPVMRGYAFILKVVTLPLRTLFTVIKTILWAFGEMKNGIEWLTQALEENGIKWEVLYDAIKPIVDFIADYLLETIRTIIDLVELLTKGTGRLAERWKQFYSPLDIVYSIFKNLVGVISDFFSYLQQTISQINIFRKGWEILSNPLQFVHNLLNNINGLIKSISNSAIGKIFGWDKKDDKEEEKQKLISKTQETLYKHVQSSNLDPITKQGMLNELDKQKLATSNVNDIRKAGQTYNHNNNQRQVIINQNFSEGSMPIDARNMTRKEARKMFIDAFGYRRAVGSKGILR